MKVQSIGISARLPYMKNSWQSNNIQEFPSPFSVFNKTKVNLCKNASIPGKCAIFESVKQ